MKERVAAGGLVLPCSATTARAKCVDGVCAAEREGLRACVLLEFRNYM